MTIRILLPMERWKFEEHLKRLDYNDRMMRFESSTTDEAITKYVSGIDLSQDAIFGFFDEHCTLRAAAHVAFAHGTADLGLSVEAPYRKAGNGANLLARAVEWSRFRAKRFSSQCLTQNRWMMRRLLALGCVIERDHETAIATVDLKPVDYPLTYKALSEENLGWLSYGTKLFFRYVGYNAHVVAA